MFQLLQIFLIQIVDFKIQDQRIQGQASIYAPITSILEWTKVASRIHGYHHHRQIIYAKLNILAHSLQGYNAQH